MWWLHVGVSLFLAFSDLLGVSGAVQSPKTSHKYINAAHVSTHKASAYTKKNHTYASPYYRIIASHTKIRYRAR
ncbi:hypothetical protein skT53_29430 [Effusibacillus dendaii]|uniref:Uncharacterized protein n=1 Tax=Effusibacillus dendaii TaxID=2743772 RepID=A0A7I8DCQ1_9BACL|nr:hypothetical protein skT53_29430 [Effusibacillus dendaii]